MYLPMHSIKLLMFAAQMSVIAIVQRASMHLVGLPSAGQKGSRSRMPTYAMSRIAMTIGVVTHFTGFVVAATVLPVQWLHRL